jgi:hypothetical protein
MPGVPQEWKRSLMGRAAVNVTEDYDWPASKEDF